MKKKLLAGISAALLVGSASIAIAGVLSYNVGGGVKDSPHNMPAYLVAKGQSPTTSQLCIFCHTPHNSPGTGVGGYNPLWNHKIDTAGFIPYEGFDTSNPRYVDGTMVQGEDSSLNALIDQMDVMRGPSRLCMSCHDGNSAIDAYTQNGPGSYTPAIVETSGSPIIAGDLTKLAAGGDVRPASPYNAGGTKDLRNDHPIGFNYNDVVNGNIAMGIVADPNIRSASTDVAGALIENTHTSIPKIVNVLYKGETLTCASCHDVHNTNGTSPGGAFDKPLLRVKNDGSRLCLMCHSK